MSYQVLARKYRPRSFFEVAGQQHILNSLIHALDQNRLHHAYLFTGTRGVGKTSLARLLAKSVNCLNGISSNPCGQCEHCIAIDQGRFIDLLEIDAASRTKVEDTREILDNVQYMPSQGKYKIYLIDEVHMLSQHSFNALLKTLEEPPDHVKFLLATTDPHKLPITILSRCLQFNLKHLSEVQIEQKLVEILGMEVIPFELNGLKIISHAADGSMRDALSLTDQSIAYSKGEILTKDVQVMLGIVNKEMIDKLLVGLLEENTEAVIDFSQEVILAGKKPESVLNALAECFYYASLHRFTQQNIFSLPCSMETLEVICQKYTPVTLQLYYQLTLKSKEDLHLAPNAQCGLGMALLRLCAFSLELDPTLAEPYTENQTSNVTSKLLIPLNKKPDLKALKASVSSSEKIYTKNTEIKNFKASGKKIMPLVHYLDNTSDSVLLSNNINVNWYQLSQSLGLKGATLQIVLNSRLIKFSQNLYTLCTVDTVKGLITDKAIRKIEEALSNKQGYIIKVIFSHLGTNPLLSSKTKNTYKPDSNIQSISLGIAEERLKNEIINTSQIDPFMTPSQVIQKKKSQKVDEIYASLKANQDIQNLKQLGFKVTSENIKLKS